MRIDENPITICRFVLIPSGKVLNPTILSLFIFPRYPFHLSPLKMFLIECNANSINTLWQYYWGRELSNTVSCTGKCFSS